MMVNLFRKLKRFAADGRGVAAIEFAFIAPLLLTMYFVTMEIAPAIDSNKKVGRAASMIADLVTQQQQITKAELQAIMRIGQSTLNPYSRTPLNITITAIQMSSDESPTATVAWSRKMVDGNFSAGETKGAATAVPPKLKVPDSYLIRVEAELEYQPIITWSASQKEATGLLAAFDKIEMKESYYLRPRMSNTVPCTDC